MRHIAATFHRASEVPTPKVKGVRSGYAPHHRFKTVDYLASGFHLYDDKDAHFPGETIKMQITFPSWEHLREHVKEGDTFDVFELDRLVGRGTVEKIL